MCSKQQSKDDVMSQSEEWNVIRVLNIAQWCFELLLLSRNQKKSIGILGVSPEGNVHDRKYKDTFFLGGPVFLAWDVTKDFGTTCLLAPMFCYYFQLLCFSEF